jgi:hypothetical protein
MTIEHGEMRGVSADDGAPIEHLVAGAVGDRCVSCGAPLSSDQRYCVNCGERRGRPRFSLPTAVGAFEPPAPTSEPPRRPSRPRPSSGATLVAGVGTLLLAMGVGVLIGHSNSSSPKQVAASAPQVITVNGGSGNSGSAGASSGSGSGSGASSSKSKSSKGNGKSKGSHSKARSTSGPPPSKAAAHAAQNAANKVLGGSNKNVPPPTVTVGQKGHGSGYNKKTGKFDGSFFGN